MEMVEQDPLFPDFENKKSMSPAISDDLSTALEKSSEDVKTLLQKINEVSQEIANVNHFERYNATFANNIINLWQKHQEIISIICEKWCEKLDQVVGKISQLKEKFDLDINHLRVASLIWHMREFFQIGWNDNPLPINVINWVICPAFWCSQEEEKKIALWGAYQ